MTHKTEIAFVLGIMAGSTFVGYQFGRITAPKECPRVVGERVVSTVDRGHEQACTYVQTKGFNLKTRKL